MRIADCGLRNSTIFLGAALIGLLAPQSAHAQGQIASLQPIVQDAQERLRRELVEVHVNVLEDKTAAYGSRTQLESVFDRYAAQHISLRLAGVRVTPEGTVLLRDPNMPLKRYGEIKLKDHEGNVVPGRLVAILASHAGVMAAPKRKPDAPLPHVAFSEPTLAPGQLFFVAAPLFLEDRLGLSVAFHFALAPIGKEPLRVHQMLRWEYGLSLPRTTAIILNADGSAMGVALDNALWDTPGGTDSWVGRNIMADQRLTPDTLQTIQERIRARSALTVKEIEIYFRSDSYIARKLPLEEGKITQYGVLLNTQGAIFVPTPFFREAVQQIEKIVVRDDGTAVEARFEGLYRDLAAFRISAKGISGKPAIVTKTVPFPRGKIFYALSVRRRFGRREDTVEYNRYLDTARGYRDSRHPVPLKSLRIGDLIADESGRLLGFYAPQREEDHELRARLGAQLPSKAGRPQARIYLFSEIADLLAHPKDHYDPAARPMSRREEQHLVWLGVEFQTMNAALARDLGAEGATRDGKRGLLVTHVYPASPAERHGIEVGDILLSVTVPGKPVDWDLAPARRKRPAGVASDVAKRASRSPWRARRNYLTTGLTLLGEGREIRLRLVHGSAEKVIPVKLEKAPDDFSTANSYHEPALGITVREMTYEVRSLLRRPADAAGVIVSDIEPDGRAALARIRPYEIITRVNDRAVHSPKEFERALRSAAATGRAELLVTCLGQSRIVEVDLQAGAY